MIAKNARRRRYYRKKSAYGAKRQFFLTKLRFFGSFRLPETFLFKLYMRAAGENFGIFVYNGWNYCCDLFSNFQKGGCLHYGFSKGGCITDTPPPWGTPLGIWVIFVIYRVYFCEIWAILGRFRPILCNFDYFLAFFTLFWVYFKIAHGFPPWKFHHGWAGVNEPLYVLRPSPLMRLPCSFRFIVKVSCSTFMIHTYHICIFFNFNTVLYVRTLQTIYLRRHMRRRFL